MIERQRAAAVGGIVGVVVTLVGIGFIGDAPDPHQDASATARYFVEHRNSVFVSFVVVLVGLGGLLWFLAWMTERLHANGAPVTARLLAAVAFAVLALLAINELLYATLAFQVASDAPPTAKALFILTVVSSTLLGGCAAAVIGLASVGALSTGSLPRWYAYVGIVAAVLLLPATASFADSEYFSPDVQQQVVLQVFLLWVLIASVLLVRRGAAHPSRRPHQNAV